MADNKKTVEAAINVKYFYALPDKASVKIAGIIKKIDDKPTPYGSVKRFTGDIVVTGEKENYQTKKIFVPDQIRDSILDEVKKIGKWKSFEFVLTAIKTLREDKSSSWVVSYNIKPRIELPRVLALLDV